MSSFRQTLALRWKSPRPVTAPNGERAWWFRAASWRRRTGPNSRVREWSRDDPDWVPWRPARLLHEKKVFYRGQPILWILISRRSHTCFPYADNVSLRGGNSKWALTRESIQGVADGEWKSCSGGKAQSRHDESGGRVSHDYDTYHRSVGSITRWRRRVLLHPARPLISRARLAEPGFLQTARVVTSRQKRVRPGVGLRSVGELARLERISKGSASSAPSR